MENITPNKIVKEVWMDNNNREHSTKLEATRANIEIRFYELCEEHSSYNSVDTEELFNSLIAEGLLHYPTDDHQFIAEGLLHYIKS